LTCCAYCLVESACQAVLVLLDRVAFLVEWFNPEFFGEQAAFLQA
jgi:hypothetical protein